MQDKMSPGRRPRHGFVYSAYWQTWSRVLLVGWRGSSFVELNLTPINPDRHSSWEEQVRPQVLRMHMTQRDFKKGDRTAAELPPGALSDMRHHLGDKELVSRLLTYDYVSNVDLSRVAALTNGGVEFDQVKQPWADEHPGTQLFYLSGIGHALQGTVIKALDAYQYTDPDRIASACQLWADLQRGLQDLATTDERPDVKASLARAVTRIEEGRSALRR